MIDLHSHVLAELDDGACSMDETVKMLEIAVSDGIRTIAGTPHYNCFSAGFPDVAAERLTQVQHVVAERGLPISVVGGFEVMLSPVLGALGKDAQRLGLNGSHYLLFELPARFRPPFVDRVIFELQSAGLRPILTHAERYEFIVRNPDVAADFVARDVLLQVNADSLLGAWGRKVQRCARYLVERGLVSFLASDSHSSRRRAPRLQAAANVVSRLVGASAAEAMVLGNPEAVLADLDLPPAAPLIHRRFFSVVPMGWLHYSARDRWQGVTAPTLSD